jgi:hypothetical protein
MALLDALPHLPIATLEEWLPLAADLLNRIGNTRMKLTCRNRFWEVLSSGEMDVERAATCVAWWSTRGGRELVLSGPLPEKPDVMSGALVGGGDGSRL